MKYFCPKCDTEISGPDATCSACGHRVRPGYCIHCGAQLSEQSICKSCGQFRNGKLVNGCVTSFHAFRVRCLPMTEEESTRLLEYIRKPHRFDRAHTYADRSGIVLFFLAPELVPGTENQWHALDDIPGKWVNKFRYFYGAKITKQDQNAFLTDYREDLQPTESCTYDLKNYARMAKSQTYYQAQMPGGLCEIALCSGLFADGDLYLLARSYDADGAEFEFIVPPEYLHPEAESAGIS